MNVLPEIHLKAIAKLTITQKQLNKEYDIYMDLLSMLSEAEFSHHGYLFSRSRIF